MTTLTQPRPAPIDSPPDPCVMCGHPLHSGLCERFQCHCLAPLPAREASTPRAVPVVLVISRAPDRLTEVAGMLAEWRYRVALATTYDDAVFAFSENPPDIVVLDVLGISLRDAHREMGLGTFQEWLRGQHREQPFGVVYLVTPGMRAGSIGHLGPRVKKPIVADVFRQAVRSVTPFVMPLPSGDCGLVVDLRRNAAVSGHYAVALTPIETRLLAFMASHPGEVFHSDELLRRVWGYGDTAGSSTLCRAHISNLREKLRRLGADEYLHTIRSKGYRWMANVAVIGR